MAHNWLQDQFQGTSFGLLGHQACGWIPPSCHCRTSGQGPGLGVFPPLSVYMAPSSTLEAKQQGKFLVGFKVDKKSFEQMLWFTLKDLAHREARADLPSVPGPLGILVALYKKKMNNNTYNKKIRSHLKQWNPAKMIFDVVYASSWEENEISLVFKRRVC